jgi:hypothetical protein
VQGTAETDSTKETGPATEHRIETFSTRRQSLWVRPVDPELDVVWLPLALSPATAGTMVDLGTVVVPSRSLRRLTVEDTDGRVLAAWVTIHRGSVSWSEEVDADGLAEGEAFTAQEGDRVLIDAAGFAPLRTQLVGPGPWTVRFPGGGVRITVRDSRGKLDAYQVHVDGEPPVAGGADGITMRGLAEGTHSILILCPGYRAQDPPRRRRAAGCQRDPRFRTLTMA